MNEFLQQIEQLSPEKRELLNLFLQAETSELQNNYVAPRTPVEETLSRIWGQVLDIEQIGINDNFFELGGDSIQSIQIIAKTNQAGIQITTNQLFEYPTIAELIEVAQVQESPEMIKNSEQENLSSSNFTPSDFPESELSQAEINQLFIQDES